MAVHDCTALTVIRAGAAALAIVAAPVRRLRRKFFGAHASHLLEAKRVKIALRRVSHNVWSEKFDVGSYPNPKCLEKTIGCIVARGNGGLKREIGNGVVGGLDPVIRNQLRHSKYKASQSGCGFCD